MKAQFFGPLLGFLLILFALSSGAELIAKDDFDWRAFAQDSPKVPLPLNKRQFDLPYRPRPLVRRQSDSCAPLEGPDTPLCEPLCVPSNYLCATQPIDKRSLFDVPAKSVYWWPRSDALRNISITDDGLHVRSIHARQFNDLTQDELNTYVEDQFDENNYDKYFGEPEGTVEGDTDYTVFAQINFGSKPFQISGGPLHGCTQIIVVSSTTVWMGHIWEPNWWSRDTEVTAQSILNWITGNGPIFPTNGQPLTANLFQNGARVYIMTVRSDGKTATYKSTKYKAKIGSVVSALQGVLGSQVPIYKYNYVRSDDDVLFDGVVGKALFQFDPNSDGNNTPGWRLFMEQNRFSSTDQVPTSAGDLANALAGIPPYNGP